MSAPHLPSPAPSPFPQDPLAQPGMPGMPGPSGAPAAAPPAAPAADAAPPAAADDTAAVRADAEARLVALAQDLYEMEVCAGEVGVGMEDAVPKYLSKVAAGLAGLVDVAARMGETVPWQVVENIDRYKNPHQYTKNTLSRATGENQYALGRVLGLESFRRQLVDSLSSAFPALDLPEREHRPALPDAPQPSDVKLEAEDGEGDGSATPRAGDIALEAPPVAASSDGADGANGASASGPSGGSELGGAEPALAEGGQATLGGDASPGAESASALPAQ